MQKFRNTIFYIFLMMGGLFGFQSAEAACVVTNLPTLNFDAINPVFPQSSNELASVDLRYECEPNKNQLVCIEIYGSRGPNNMRTLSHVSSPSNQMAFNIFKDPARQVVWDHGNDSVSGLIVAYGKDWNGSGVQSIYGRLYPTGELQTGLYTASIRLVIRQAQTPSGPCMGKPSESTLTVIANVLKACTVSATTLDFGVQPSNFSGPINATSQINTHCANGTDYQIALNNGLHSVGNTRRMKSADGDYIPYELYNNPQRTQRWGETLNTAETKKLTSTGHAHQSIVYGQVLPTQGLAAAQYKDTITVTVTY